MKTIYTNSIHNGAKNQYRRGQQQQEEQPKERKYTKVLYHVKLYNYVDDSHALYIRNTEKQARELAEEKLMCQQVRSVSISRVIITETILDTITWDLNKKPVRG